MLNFLECKRMVENEEGYILKEAEEEKNTRSKVVVWLTVMHKCGKEFQVEAGDWEDGIRCNCKDMKAKRKYSCEQIQRMVEESNEFKLLKIFTRRTKHQEVRYVKVRCLKCNRIWNKPLTNVTSVRTKCHDCETSRAMKLPIEIWKQRVEVETKGEFLLEDVYYRTVSSGGKTAVLRIKHSECGHEFDRRGGQWYATSKSCPRCTTLMTVSYTHAILALLFEKYYKGTIFEKDIGFRGGKGGLSAYDVFVPNLDGRDTLIEFQSRYHDNTTKKDRRKKEYAESKGYKCLQIDHREKSTIEVVQSFFPFLEEIPEQIKKEVKRFYKLDVQWAQSLLSQGISISKIAEIMGCKSGALYSAVRDGRLKKNSDHNIRVYGIKQVVQLDMSGNFVQEFPSRNSAYVSTGINLDSALKGICKYAGGYIWLYKEVYERGDYQIPLKARGYTAIIKQVDSEGNLIRRFNNIDEIVEALKLKKKNIQATLRGERNTTNGYRFVLEER